MTFDASIPSTPVKEYPVHIEIPYHFRSVEWAKFKEKRPAAVDWLYTNVGYPSYRGDTRPFRGWSVQTDQVHDGSKFRKRISFFFINEEDAIMFKLMFGDPILSGD